MESPRLLNRMQEQKIDIALTHSILEKINDPNRIEPEPVTPRAIPGIDGVRVLDRRAMPEFRIPEGVFASRAEELELPGILIDSVYRENGQAIIAEDILEQIGLCLLPRVSYGVLNGGSASSYADHKKNNAFSPALFKLCRDPFEQAAALCLGRAKGITPAFVHPDGTPGPSFMELKMRAVLIRILQSQIGGTGGTRDLAPLAPLFQMTSVLNDTQIQEAFSGYAQSPLLEPLIRRTGVQIHRVETGIQPLVAAFTPAEPGVKKEIFQDGLRENR